MVRDMTSGSPMKLIVGFAVPIFLGNLFQQLYSVVDAMVLGRAVGADALAAAVCHAHSAASRMLIDGRP